MNKKGAVCGALLRRCRNCNYRYSREDTANKIDLCPECGKPRSRCANAPVGDSGRCRFHGGENPKGIAANRYQGRGYSKYLPRRILTDYETALNDPALGELASEVALIEARMSEVIRQLGTGESGEGWKSARAQMTQLIMTLQSPNPDPAAQANALQLLRDTINRGAADSGLWYELRDLIESKRRLVESEQKRIVQGKMYLTLDKAGLLIDALTRAVIDHVKDREVLSGIQRDWTKYLGKIGESGQYELSTGVEDSEAA